MIPLYDNDPFEAPFRPYVTWSLIALNLLAFVAGLASPDTDAFTAHWGVVPASITDAPGAVAPLQAYGTLFTGMFLHGGWLHLIGNMLYLQVFGDDIEEALGRGRYLLFYVLSGLSSATIYVASNAGSTVPMVGASGAISGVLAAYLLLKPCAKVTVLLFYRAVRLQAMWVIGLWVGLQLLDIMLADSTDEVAYSAILAGWSRARCCSASCARTGSACSSASMATRPGATPAAGSGRACARRTAPGRARGSASVRLRRRS